MNFLQRVKSLFKGAAKPDAPSPLPARPARGKDAAPRDPAKNAARPHRGPRFEKAAPPRNRRSETWHAGDDSAPSDAPASPSLPLSRKPGRKDRSSSYRPSRRNAASRRAAETPSAPPADASFAKKARLAAEAHAAWDPASWQVPADPDRARFLDFDLPSELQHALADLGFRYCTPIQEKALPRTLAGGDVCGRAQTGTGKTAAFLLAVFERFLRRPADPGRHRGYPRALVMAPTRELCMQIAADAAALAKYTPFRIVALYGGMDMVPQRNALREHPVDLVVATPGRLLDFRKQQEIDFSSVEILVIDEADRMLDMGFIPDMRRIIYSCPPVSRRQTLLFSATLEPPVTRLAAQWMRDPAVVDIEPEHVAAETIDQRVYIVTAGQKFAIVCNILRTAAPARTIIFGNRRDATETICENLRHQGFSTELLSGAVDQHRRVRVLDDFKAGRIPVLVATDVAGRGLHIDDVDLIINYNIPEQAEDYVHRIGRTGRVGRKGTSITFADELDSYQIPAIEEYMKQPLRCVPPPEEWLAPLEKPMLEARPRRRPSSPSGSRRPPRRPRRR